MKICMTHYRVGETDGVSLEMDKWRLVLEGMGHEVVYLAGSAGTSEAFIVDEYEYRNEEDNIMTENCYTELTDYASGDELKAAIDKRRERVEEKFYNYFVENKIDMVVPNNVFALGRSLSTSQGMLNAIRRLNLKTVCHHHDFFWEREHYNKKLFPFVEEHCNTNLPPADNNFKHCVINTAAKKDLFTRRKLEATVVPNVFDFNKESWKEDEYNSDFRETLGLRDNDLFILQGTRVTDRKAIELAVDLVADMNLPENRAKLMEKPLYNGRKFNEDSKIVFVLAGMSESVTGYEDRLKKHIEEKGIDAIWCNDIIAHSRETGENSKKIYSLWDAYVQSDIVTYPSIYEGWGNQFLEGLFAKKPQVVFEYSVFLDDIKSRNFNYVSLGHEYKINEKNLAEINHERIQEATKGTIEYLTNKEKRDADMEANFELGKKYFSLEALKTILEKVFPKA